MKNTLIVRSIAIIFFTSISFNCMAFGKCRPSKSCYVEKEGEPFWSDCTIERGKALQCGVKFLNENAPFYKGDIFAGDQISGRFPFVLPEKYRDKGNIRSEYYDPIKFIKKIDAINESININIDKFNDTLNYTLDYNSDRIATDAAKEIKDTNKIAIELANYAGSYTAYLASPDAPHDRSSKLLELAGNETFITQAANSLIKSDNQILAVTSKLPDSIEKLNKIIEMTQQDYMAKYYAEKNQQSLANNAKMNEEIKKEKKSPKTSKNTETQSVKKEVESNWILNKGGVACVTKEQYSTQLSYVSSGVNKLIEGCIITKKDYYVVLLEQNVFSSSKVVILDGDITVWTDFTFLRSKIPK